MTGNAALTTPESTAPQSPPEEPSVTVSGSPGETRRRAGALLALARFETRELLFQVQILLFFALDLVYVVLQMTLQEGMDDYPVLNQVDRATQPEPLLFAIAVLVCVNAAVLRSRKHGTTQQFDVLAMEPWRRTVAHVLSVVPYAALTALLVAAEYLWEALKPGAIGHGSLGELAIAPLTIMLAGIAGVLLARLVPSGFAPLVFVIAFYMAMVVASDAAAEGKWWGWLSPLVFPAYFPGDPVPADLLGRPAGWHAVYLLGLCAVLACVALLRSGGRTRAVKVVTAVALATTAAGVVGQLPHDKAALEAARRAASETPEKVQSCTEYDGSKYCSFPEWSGVRDDWSAVVDGVQSLAGGKAATTALTVRQRIDTSGGVEADTYIEPATTPGQVTVGTRWGGNRVPEFAVGVATVLVTGTEKSVLQDMCDARMVTIMWLVLGNDPSPAKTFQNVRLDDSTEGSGLLLTPTDGIGMTANQSTVVNELLERPHAEVAARVKEHWTELTSAATTTAQAARLLGVEQPKEAEKCGE